MRIHKIYFFVLIAIISDFAAAYKTPEFNNPDSSVAMMYQCAVVGHKKGFAPDAITVISKARKMLKITIKKSGELLNDAFKWYEINEGVYDFQGLWKDLCELPFENLRSASE